MLEMKFCDLLLEDTCELGRNIRKYRREHCMSQTELAAKVNVSRYQIIKLERGHIIVPFDVLLKICSEIEMPFSLLLKNPEMAQELMKE